MMTFALVGSSVIGAPLTMPVLGTFLGWFLVVSVIALTLRLLTLAASPSVSKVTSARLDTRAARAMPTLHAADYAHRHAA